MKKAKIYIPTKTAMQSGRGKIKKWILKFETKYIYFTICFLILTLSEILVRYSGISWNYTSLYYLFPIGLLPLFYFVLIKKFKYENLK